MSTLNRKGSLVSSRVLASVAGMATLSTGLSLGLMTETASADLNGNGAPVYLATAWDNAAFFGTVVDAWIGYGFAGYTTPIYSYFNGAAYTVDFSVGASNRPGWQYEAVIDYNGAGIGPQYNGLGYSWISVYMYIKGNLNGGNPITQYTLKDGLGNSLVPAAVDLGSNGAYLIFQVDINAVIAGGNIIDVQWNQGSAPAPGALALLGLSGLVGSRRRRS